MANRLNYTTPVLHFLLFSLLIACNNNRNAEHAKTIQPVKDSSSVVIKNLQAYSEDTWKPAYKLITPEGWTVERIPFPIEFAPQIPYKGVEELRFAHGWGDVQSEEHWTYAFLWWLDGKPVIDAEVLKDHLQQYYTGLVASNITRRKIPADKLVPTLAIIRKTTTSEGDRETYNGSVTLLNYMSQSPVTLNCMVHIKECNTPDNTAIFFEISPKSYDHRVWKELKNINKQIQCGN